MPRIFLIIILLFTASLSYAKPPIQPLRADQAFVFTAHINDKHQLLLEWQIAPGYYLYKDKLSIQLAEDSQIKLEKPKLPSGVKINLHGIHQVYTDTLSIPVALVKPAKGILNLSVHYQGCAKDGFCYPPMKKDLQAVLSPESDVKNVIITGVMHAKAPEKNPIEAIFNGKSNFIIVLSFLGMGLLLAFTPCILPMVPILSGIILGHKHMTTGKAFSLSLAYVLGMAVTYAAAGMVVALIGSHIQTLFQSPWAIVLGSGLFILLALSLFGFYELALPNKWQQKLTEVSNHQKGGTYLGVFIMGALSSLIVSPCVSAPLVGVLAYIAQTGNVVLGGVTLLALGIGMGIPLLLIGMSAGKFLPKAGGWMLIVERIFGILLLGLAIWLLARIIPGPLALLLWAILFICSAIYMGAFTNTEDNWQKLFRGLGLVILIYGIILMVGAVLGNSDPLRPLEGTRLSAKKAKLPFVVTTTMAQLDEQLAAAKQSGKPVMLDFYADWCVSCVAMDRNVFSQPQIWKQLSGMTLLKVDITKNNEFDQALLKRFNVVAPPTILFFNGNGQELADVRIVGGLSADDFLNHLQKI